MINQAQREKWMVQNNHLLHPTATDAAIQTPSPQRLLHLDKQLPVRLSPRGRVKQVYAAIARLKPVEPDARPGHERCIADPAAGSIFYPESVLRMSAVYLP